MTKTAKTVIFLIIMMIIFIHTRCQLGLLVILLLFAACVGKKDETPVLPPPTSPLSQVFIGFGVVNVSYTRVSAIPAEDNPEENSSTGYLRRGAVVNILERRLIKNRGNPESWVLVDNGWLRESFVDIYDTEAQAHTASESMGK